MIQVASPRGRFYSLWLLSRLFLTFLLGTNLLLANSRNCIPNSLIPTWQLCRCPITVTRLELMVDSVSDEMRFVTTGLILSAVAVQQHIPLAVSTDCRRPVCHHWEIIIHSIASQKSCLRPQSCCLSVRLPAWEETSHLHSSVYCTYEALELLSASSDCCISRAVVQWGERGCDFIPQHHKYMASTLTAPTDSQTCPAAGRVMSVAGGRRCRCWTEISGLAGRICTFRIFTL